MTLEAFLIEWRGLKVSNVFPSKEASIAVTRMDPGTYEREMLRLLDAGLVGMVGFRYCWPEVAKEDYARLDSIGAVRSARKVA